MSRPINGFVYKELFANILSLFDHDLIARQENLFLFSKKIFKIWFLSDCLVQFSVQIDSDGTKFERGW